MRDAVDYLYPGRGTAIGDALARAVDLARGTIGTETGSDAPAQQTPSNDDRDHPVTAILMLSDGAQTEGILQPFEGAQLAKEAGIPVYTVALGTAEGTVTINRFGVSRTIPVPPDPVTLEQIATDTDGDVLRRRSRAHG